MKDRSNIGSSMHAYLTEIHYAELAELNMSQRCKISVQHYIYSYLKGSDNIHNVTC